MATQVTRKPPTYGNRIFDHGVLSGISWFRQGDTPNVPPTAAMIVEFIKDNMIEFAIDDSLSEEQLRQDVGIVAGFVHRNCIRLDGARKIDYIGGNRCSTKTKIDISPRSGRSISETISVVGTNATKPSGSP